MLDTLFFIFRMGVICGWNYLLYLIGIQTKYNCLKLIAQNTSKLNPLFIKLFQAFAIHNDFLSEDLTNILSSFSDSVTWSYVDIDTTTLMNIQTEFGIGLTSMTPINAGMISIVFSGLDEEGNKIVVKIKRKNIEDILARSFDQLTRAILFLNYFCYTYNLFDLLETNKKSILSQTCFQQEVDNLLLMKRNCRLLKYVVIPNVYKHITQKYDNVIVMSFIDGVKCDAILPSEKIHFAKHIIKFGFVTALMHGVVHADLHSGNILFIREQQVVTDSHPHEPSNPHLDSTHEPQILSPLTLKIGILDFGIIHHIGPTNRDAFINILYPLFDSDIKLSIDQLLQSGLIEPPDFYANITNIQRMCVNELLTQFITANLKQIGIYTFMHNLKQLLNHPTLITIGVKPSKQFMQLQLIMGMSQGVTISLCENSEVFLKLADETLSQMLYGGRCPP